MSTVSLPNTIANADPLDATKVQANDAALRDYINTEVVVRDGAMAMTGVLSLPATTPTLGVHATNKTYVDAQITAEALARTTAASTALLAGQHRDGAQALRAANQSFTSTVAAFVIFDTEVWDSSTYFAPSSNTITVPAGKDGIYVISSNLVSAYGDFFNTEIRVNGTVVCVGNSTAEVTLTNYHNACSTVQMLAAGATVQLVGRQDNAGAKNAVARMSIARISA